MNKDFKGSITKKITLSGLFAALGIVLPFFTGQIPKIGSMLLPMHIPVMICGYVCGWKWGFAVGFVVPLLRSIMFGMPPMIPTAAAMAIELAVYGGTIGIIYPIKNNKKSWIYVSLIVAMITGRAVWGIASLFIYGMMGNAFTGSIFLAGALINALPGIILQLVLIPIIIMILQKNNIIS